MRSTQCAERDWTFRWLISVEANYAMIRSRLDLDMSYGIELVYRPHPTATCRHSERVPLNQLLEMDAISDTQIGATADLRDALPATKGYLRSIQYFIQ